MDATHGRRSMRTLFASIAIPILLLAGGTMSLTVATASPAAALCSASDPLPGDWKNIDANSRAMARVVVQTCQQVVTCNGDLCTSSYSGTFLTPYGKCSPTNCNWGRKQAQSMGDGWFRTIHDFGFVTSHVWVRTYSYGLTYLRVWVYNDFTPSDGRADYTTDEWFLK